MRLVFEDAAAIGAWVAARLPGHEFKASSAIGIEADDRLVAGLVYSGYRPGISIEMSIAAESPRWCRRGVLRAIFSYPFDQLGVRRVQAIVAHGNERSLRLVRGLGFVEEGRLREAWPDGQDAVVFAMLRHDCRWLEVR